MNRRRLTVGLLLLLFGAIVVSALMYRTGRDWFISSDSRLHPFQQRRDAIERPALDDLLKAVRQSHQLNTAPTPRPTWIAFAHFERSAIPDLSSPPLVSGVSISRVELVWAPLVYLDVNANVYQLRLYGNHQEGSAPRTIPVSFTDGKRVTVGMSPFEWSMAKQGRTRQYVYSDFWQQEQFGHPLCWQGAAGRIDWANFVWVVVHPKSPSPAPVEWIFPADKQQTVYYSIRTDARGRVAEAIIGLHKGTNGVITVGARVRGTQTSVRLNIGESRTQWGYYFAVISGQELLNRL